MRYKVIPFDNYRWPAKALKNTIKIDPVVFGRYLSRLRTSKRLKQAELGRAIYKRSEMSYGSSQSRVSRIERGLVNIDEYLINRVATIFEVPVETIQKECSKEDSTSTQEINYNLSFDPKLLDYFPSLDSYIQIINQGVKNDDITSSVLAFLQMCESAHRHFKHLLNRDNPPPCLGSVPED
jgi:transcriptional regulator with XRE-family HTH domain